MMTPGQRKAVLRIARAALRREMKSESSRQYPGTPLPGDFGGCFVTLRSANGRLRGCMGSFKPLGTMAETVDRVARMSLTEDSRFKDHRIAPNELDGLLIEVSVLEEPQVTDNPAGLRVGRHGILIKQGKQQGCLLPQVAVERGWSAEEFLSQCCVLKAGLPKDAWRNEAEVYLFKTEIVGHED